MLVLSQCSIIAVTSVEFEVNQNSSKDQNPDVQKFSFVLQNTLRNALRNSLRNVL